MPSDTLTARRLVPLGIVAAASMILVLARTPGSLSAVGTKWLSALGLTIPRVDLMSEIPLALLALITAAVIVTVWWKHPAQRARTAVTSAGVVLAYVASEGLKALFAQSRPCSRWASAAQCPPPGDWSLPSNHSTLAFGAAAVVAVLLGSAAITWTMIGIAAMVAAGRVVEGMHYVHDVAIGALLGITIPTLLVLAFDAVRRYLSAVGRTREAESPLAP